MIALLLAISAYLGIIRPSHAAVPPQAALAHGFPLAAYRNAPSGAPVKKDPVAIGIPTKARGAVVIDWKSGAVLTEKNADEALPIASISKLLTAVVVADHTKDWDGVVTIQADDERPGGVAYLLPGERVRIADLFNLSLVASSNGATIALARSTGLSPQQFAAEMNAAAARIGMDASSFVEPTGLDPHNVASARDVAILVRKALGYAEIAAAVQRPAYEFTALTGRSVHVRSTDELLGALTGEEGMKLLGGKTGYLEEAGYCFGAAAESEDNHRIVAVVLGAPSKDERFNQVHSLMAWTFGAYDWPPRSANL